jgi:hypothetical protein
MFWSNFGTSQPEVGTGLPSRERVTAHPVIGYQLTICVLSNTRDYRTVQTARESRRQPRIRHPLVESLEVLARCVSCR